MAISATYAKLWLIWLAIQFPSRFCDLTVFLGAFSAGKNTPTALANLAGRPKNSDCCATRPTVCWHRKYSFFCRMMSYPELHRKRYQEVTENWLPYSQLIIIWPQIGSFKKMRRSSGSSFKTDLAFESRCGCPSICFSCYDGSISLVAVPFTA